MKYISTRGNTAPVSSAEAIVKGLCADGGLYVPESFPRLEVSDCMNTSYQELAKHILSMYLTDFDAKEISDCVDDAYKSSSFEDKFANLVALNDSTYSMELWHGPTCAFKDYALQLMPHLFVCAKRKLNNTKTTKILVATSGDTGKAALEGYKNKDNIKIIVFYPNDGTSEMQRLQMTTQEGDNVFVYAINGNFDDAQTAVKAAFLSDDLTHSLKCKGEELSSANSINLGRLLPQIIYYYYAYCQLAADNSIALGDKVDFCVPTGNFGDILAGYYAKNMGLPIGKLICASNRNNVLYDFINTGVYNARRDFYKTSSPSMDILISSNLERLLYHISNDGSLVNELMDKLNLEGNYTLPQHLLSVLQESFVCDYATDEDANAEIAYQYTNNHYLSDTHTAVAFKAARLYKDAIRPCVVISTASPFKFPSAVLAALGMERPDNEFTALDVLEKNTACKAPQSLKALQHKKIRFTEIISKDALAQLVCKA